MKKTCTKQFRLFSLDFSGSAEYSPASSRRRAATPPPIACITGRRCEVKLWCNDVVLSSNERCSTKCQGTKHLRAETAHSRRDGNLLGTQATLGAARAFSMVGVVLLRCPRWGGPCLGTPIFINIAAAITTVAGLAHWLWQGWCLR